jgi:hypothetical protein
MIYAVGYFVIGLIVACTFAPAYADSQSDAELGGALCFFLWPLVLVTLGPMFLSRSIYSWWNNN